MNSGVTAERVYDALKRRLLSGELLPGARLEPGRLAADLASSVTPVRDALNRLAGERLVETRASEGFHLPHLAEPMLRDLYAWNAALLRLVARSWPAGSRTPCADALPANPAQAVPALFALFAARSDNREHAAQIASANDRIAAARTAEAGTLDGLEDELGAMAVAFDQDSLPHLLRLVGSYHRRRLAAVPRILRTLYEPRPRQ
ncbi:MAG: GntR family transcriptional regulator [Pseudomonadota bacterium]